MDRYHGSQISKALNVLGLVNEKRFLLAYGEFRLIGYLVDKLHILLFWQQVNNYFMFITTWSFKLKANIYYQILKL